MRVSPPCGGHEVLRPHGTTLLTSVPESRVRGVLACEDVFVHGGRHPRQHFGGHGREDAHDVPAKLSTAYSAILAPGQPLLMSRY